MGEIDNIEWIRTNYGNRVSKIVNAKQTKYIYDIIAGLPESLSKRME